MGERESWERESWERERELGERESWERERESWGRERAGRERAGRANEVPCSELMLCSAAEGEKIEKRSGKRREDGVMVTQRWVADLLRTSSVGGEDLLRTSSVGGEDLRSILLLSAPVAWNEFQKPSSNLLL